MGQTTHMPRLAGLHYGLLGLPLAFMALPLYVHLPHVFASRYGMSLATLGAVLLLARLWDALTDPLLGHWCDRVMQRSPDRLLRYAAVAAMLVAVGMALLFAAQWTQPVSAASLLMALMLTYLAYSWLAIAHQSWGARLGGDASARARVVAWREGAGLVGVVLASVLPGWVGWDAWCGVFVLALACGWLGWNRAPVPPTSGAEVAWGPWRALLHPLKQPAFRRLLGIFVLNGLASAIPATLVLFFVQDVLGAAQWQALLLATYFVAAALSMPLWLRAVGRWGLAAAWLGGMVLSVVVFAWASVLGQGDVPAFALVCALSGMALGADLALPGALLAGVVAACGDQGQREGIYFGWWNLAGKLSLALASGVALPLLAALGYQPGQANADGLWALALVYAVLPCALKLLAAAALLVCWKGLALQPSSVPLFAESP